MKNLLMILMLSACAPYKSPTPKLVFGDSCTITSGFYKNCVFVVHGWGPVNNEIYYDGQLRCETGNSVTALKDIMRESEIGTECKKQ